MLLIVLTSAQKAIQVHGHSAPNASFRLRIPDGNQKSVQVRSLWNSKLLVNLLCGLALNHAGHSLAGEVKQGLNVEIVGSLRHRGRKTPVS